MVFFWTGARIVVLIFLFISAWLTSYAFEDTRFGNGSYMGWTLIWASIPTVLLFFIIKGWPESEPAPGEIPSKSSHWSHSFMFIPVAIWPVILLGGGLYLINSSEPDPDYGVVDVPHEENLEGERIINFWNPTSDTLEMNTYYESSGEQRMNQTIPPGHIRYATFEANNYKFKYKNRKGEVKVQGAEFTDALSYDQAWYILDHKVDLVLLDVTIACSDTVDRDELRDVNWMELVEERYKGGELIEPKLKSVRNIQNTVIDPTFNLPLAHAKKEKVFSLIPIDRDTEITEDYLDSVVIEICF
jgi:hypothetical protein